MNKRSISIFVSAVILCSMAYAKSSIELSERFQVPQNSVFNLDVDVGEVDIQTYDGDELIVDVRVSETDKTWLSQADWDDIALEKEINGQQVYLAIDVKDTKQAWTVRIPEDASIKVNIGVGEVDIEDANRDVQVEMGVGSVKVELDSKDYNSVELASGVGGTSLKGFKQSHSKRSTVGQEVSWQGEGQYKVSVNVGVGDAVVRD